MVYANKSDYKQSNILRKILVKSGKIIAQHFPNNAIRRIGLKMCGFQYGEKVYIGQDLIITSPVSERSCNLIIGNRVAIAPRVTIILGSSANWSNLMNFMNPIRSTVILEDDCWIGASATIMPNVTIGKMSIIGAGSVVTKDIPPYSIAVGVPAKVIKTLKSEKELKMVK